MSQETHSKEEIADYARRAASGSLNEPSHVEKDEEYQKAMRESGPYMTLGIQMAMTIVFFTGIGYLLDRSFGTSPTWTAILAGSGAVFGLTYFLVTVLRLSKKEETKSS